MAPQETFYGSVPMESQKEERPSRFLRRALVTTGVVVLVSLAVFAASSSWHRAASVADVKDATLLDKPRRPGTGDNLVMWKPDCHCRYGTCPKAKNKKDKTYCGVTNGKCMGADYGPAIDQAGKSVRFNDAIDCTKEGAGKDDKTSPCRAVCDVIIGRNQCDSFPCKNGGWCKDGKDEYTCFCKPGWTGDDCDIDINECKLEGKEKVCDENARCTNSPGRYKCACKDGWTGKGYSDAAKVAPPLWMDKIYKDGVEANKKKKGSFVYGCTDINDCTGKDRCKNGGECINQEGIPDGFSCKCRRAKRRPGVSLYIPGGICDVDKDECADKTHDCDENAVCTNVIGGQEDGYTCSCKPNWKSKDPAGVNHHGRNSRIHLTGTPSGPFKAKAAGYKAGCYDIDDCAAKPCKNGGTCEPGLPGCVDSDGNAVPCFTCKCPVGWSGRLCQNDENECVDSDKGLRKITPLAACKDKRSATCVNTAGSYGCRCNLGWTGDGVKCVDANDCEFNPCAHGGSCVDCGTLCFSCDCVVGWRGTTCGTDWNECLMGIHRCDDAATCVNTPGSYTCKCDPGYTGNGIGSNYLEKIEYTVGGVKKTKVVQHGCADIDDCAATEYDGTGKIAGWDKSWNAGPCKYGTCSDVGAGAYKCTCWDGWTDSNCDANINECDSMTGSSECSQFATCTDLPGAGNPAPPAPAAPTGGKCNDAKSKFGTDAKCAAAGYGKANTANRCADADATKCTAKECCALPTKCSASWNNKKCRTAGMGKMKKDAMCKDCKKDECCDMQTLYGCTCNPGFQGDGFHCFDKEDCPANACNKHGFCSDLGVNQYQCSCDKGWENSDCSKNINECTDFTHECGKNALCVDTQGSYKCMCPKGFKGYPDNTFGKYHDCEGINDCQSADMKGPCAHGKCTDEGVEVYRCDCEKGWTDYNCDFDVNECMGKHDCWTGTNPADYSREAHHTKDQNIKFGAAKCINTPGSYTCQCPKGMIGKGLKTPNKQFTLSETIAKSYSAKLKKSAQCACTAKAHKDSNGKCRSADTKAACLKYKGKWLGDMAQQMVVMTLPQGCVDYDDCRTPGDDMLWHSNDKNERRERLKCSTITEERGKCVDTGANSFECQCKKGWGCGSPLCDKDCNECTLGTHTCSEHAQCFNRAAAYDKAGKFIEGFSCKCNKGYFGPEDGKNCKPCMKCPQGFVEVGVCKINNNSCRDINECEGEAWHNVPRKKDNKPENLKYSAKPCDKRATCNNTPGSFACVCKPGYFAVNGKNARLPNHPTDSKLFNRQHEACKLCTVCQPGFHEHKPCTILKDTVCKRDVPSGKVIIKTEADSNLQCLTIMPGSWYPSRIEEGGTGNCGASTKAQWEGTAGGVGGIEQRVTWVFDPLGVNTKADAKLGRSDLYLIRYKGADGKCLFFGDSGKALYPSLQHCKDTYKTTGCPWGNPSRKFCGYTGGKAKLLANGQAVWRVTTLKLTERKFIIQSAARKDKDKAGNNKYECLVFEKQGTATNPSRYNWGNGESLCGVGDWDDASKTMALMNNKQAVFILESFTGFKPKA